MPCISVSSPALAALKFSRRHSYCAPNGSASRTVTSPAASRSNPDASTVTTVDCSAVASALACSSASFWMASCWNSAMACATRPISSARAVAGSAAWRLPAAISIVVCASCSSGRKVAPDRPNHHRPEAQDGDGAGDHGSPQDEPLRRVQLLDRLADEQHADDFPIIVPDRLVDRQIAVSEDACLAIEGLPFFQHQSSGPSGCRASCRRRGCRRVAARWFATRVRPSNTVATPWLSSLAASTTLSWPSKGE